jgi:hypothetical protein
MSRTLRAVMGALLAMSLGACAPTAGSGSNESSAPPAQTAEASASHAASGSIDQAVRTDADQIASDIDSAPVQVQISSNPYDYVGVSPAFKRLVARGRPAVESIAREIDRTGENGLREYLLAIAASRILNEPESEKRWSTGKEWVAQYRASH